ncbi:MAG: glycoside hydrolase family 78 protein [Tannerella sp.]|jgi:alpha-L-rhamnosidase|nr:glycoside hydrolase family 78 protein [Tannerella sp.]
MRTFIVIITACILCCCGKKTSIDELRCEYLSNPQGLDAVHPRFSWLITSAERSVYQSAYRIIVSDVIAEVKAKNGNCWDSGLRSESNTVNVPYDGTALESDRTYYWRVCSQTNGNDVWSETAEFHTGLLHEADWKALWISARDTIRLEAPVFRKSFSVDKSVKSAYVYITAAGFYELLLNGEKVGLDVLNPVITDYRQTVLYSSYNLTKHLKKGENAFGLLLGNSAYNMVGAQNRHGWGAAPIGNPRFILQMRIVYDDNSESLVTSGDEWKYTASPVTYNNLHGGEDYDARREIKDWAEAGLDETAWQNAVVVASPGGRPRWQSVPIRVTETLKPIAAIKPAQGVYLYDLGQNIAGWWRIEVKGCAGQTIRVRGAETLNNKLFPKPLELGDNMSDKFAYHSRTWTDYTLKSTKSEIYEPHFFYTGFRYIEVATADSSDLVDVKVEGRVVRSDLTSTGEWTSSNDLLNSIHRAGLWSQKGNLVGYPTDCPHREKGAYGGDGQVIAETSMHDFDMAAFYTKWLNDMRDSQRPDGWIPNTTPTLVGGMGGGVAWGSAYLLIPWWMYNYYGDRHILEEHYPNMLRYLAYLRNLARTDSKPEEPYIINYFDGYWYSLGEWCAPGGGDCPNHDVVSTFYYYYDALLLSQIAEVLDHKNESQFYASLSDTVKNAFRERFFNPSNSLVGLDSCFQTYQLLALQADIMPEEYRDGILKTIVDDIHRRDNHLNTGIIGTKYLWPTLSDAGYGDLAFKVATQETCPGYGYWIRNNSTTLLEQWDGRDSHNHEMFGAVTEYLYQYPAGIRAPGRGSDQAYRHIRFEPLIIEDLNMVKASLQTISGQIFASWQQHDGGYSYEVTIPANTHATIVLPAAKFQQSTISESGKHVWHNSSFVPGVQGVTDIKISKNSLTIFLESGTYRFVF